WPYCYHDIELGRLVLAPEYGGDGRKVDRCRDKKEPAVAFPAHWAPDGLVFYTGTQFPARYRGGAFIAFHGSWNRAPLPQQGYRVTFVPFKDGKPLGTSETFADGFWHENGTGPQHRPVGVAQGPGWRGGSRSWRAQSRLPGCSGSRGPSRRRACRRISPNR